MKISEQKIKAMVIMNIIDNCTMELDNAGQERYSLSKDQFGKVVETMVKNIKAIQSYEDASALDLLNALTAITENIDNWIESGKPADEETSKRLYDNAKEAISKALS